MPTRHGLFDQARSAQSYRDNGRGERFNYWTMVNRNAAKDETGEIMLSFLQDLDEQPLHGLRKEVIASTREYVPTLSEAQGYRRLDRLIVMNKTRGQTRKYDSTC